MSNETILEGSRNLELDAMRANLYATVFNNCPGDDAQKTKAATDAIEAFDRGRE